MMPRRQGSWPGGTIVKQPVATPEWPRSRGCSPRVQVHLYHARQNVRREDGMLRAVGAKVVVTPTNVEPEDPEATTGIPTDRGRNAHPFYANQYHNQSNPETHYKTTAPEIWEQTNEFDVFVAGMGTGGTISEPVATLRSATPTSRLSVSTRLAHFITTTLRPQTNASRPL